MTISDNISLPEPVLDILRYLEAECGISCNIHPTTDNRTVCIRFCHLIQRKFGDNFITDYIPISREYMFKNDDPDFTKHLIEIFSGNTLTPILVLDDNIKFEFPTFSSLKGLKMKLQLRERT